MLPAVNCSPHAHGSSCTQAGTATTWLAPMELVHSQARSSVMVHSPCAEEQVTSPEAPREASRAEPRPQHPPSLPWGTGQPPRAGTAPRGTPGGRSSPPGTPWGAWAQARASCASCGLCGGSWERPRGSGAGPEACACAVRAAKPPLERLLSRGWSQRILKPPKS